MPNEKTLELNIAHELLEISQRYDRGVDSQKHRIHLYPHLIMARIHSKKERKLVRARFGINKSGSRQTKLFYARYIARAQRMRT